MGAAASVVETEPNLKSKTFDFFAENFGSEESFIYTTNSDDKILFTYNPENVKSFYVKINGELLTKSDDSVSVTFRSPSRCSCKPKSVHKCNVNPSKINFNVYFNTEGFFNKKFSGSNSSNFKSIIDELEKSLE